jgi:hypothetical protein
MQTGVFRFLLVALCCWSSAGAELKTRNVFLIMSDGLRWQEVFEGAEKLLISKDAGGVRDTNRLAQDFWRETPEERRQALLPFFWEKIAREGQLLGNQRKGSVVTIKNGRNFSYPGYNEILTGIADPRIDSNDKKLNWNTNVFEWLNGTSAFNGKVAVFASWDVFPYIFNIERSRLPIWPAWDPQFKKHEAAVPSQLSELTRDTTRIWDSVIFDSFLAHAALHHLQRQRPRLMFVGFGETDEFSHSGRYDHYLRSAHQFDNYVRRLWDAAQSHSQYRNRTTFIITSDHGRGTGPEDWKHHGEKTVGSEGNWIAVLGPDTKPLGERQQTQPYGMNQVAATIAAFLGHEFQQASPESGAPIEELFQR